MSNPLTSDLRANDVVLEADDQGHRLEHRRVADDRREFLDRLARSSHPDVDDVASFQRGEQVRW